MNKDKIKQRADGIEGTSAIGAYQLALKELWDAEKDKEKWEAKALGPGDITA